MTFHLVLLPASQSGWNYLQFTNEEPGASPGEPAQAQGRTRAKLTAYPKSKPEQTPWEKGASGDPGSMLQGAGDGGCQNAFPQAVFVPRPNS